MKLYSEFLCTIVFCWFIFIFSSCRNEQITEYILDPFFSEIRIDSTDTVTLINVCKIIEAEWDSILVVHSYTTVSNQFVLRNLENYSSIKPKIQNIRNTDFYNYLVFVKNNKAIGFGKVTPQPVNFGFLPAVDERSPSVAILSKKNCDKLCMKKNGVLFIKSE